MAVKVDCALFNRRVMPVQLTPHVIWVYVYLYVHPTCPLSTCPLFCDATCDTEKPATEVESLPNTRTGSGM